MRSQAASSAARRDAWIAGIALVGLVLWEASGLDLVATRWIATPEGFPWRDHPLTSGWLHTGGRGLAWAMMALLAVDLARPLASGPSRRERARSIGLVLATLLLVPLLKRGSSTSCPWDLAEFGGGSPYVPHWWLGWSDGGPGHCFPSGHAVAAFAFFGVYFLWRHHRPSLARAMLAGVLLAGLAFGWTQWARGAHFVSHSLWSAWLCWVIAALGARCWPVVPLADRLAPAPGPTRPGCAQPDHPPGSSSSTRKPPIGAA